MCIYICCCVYGMENIDQQINTYLIINDDDDINLNRGNDTNLIEDCINNDKNEHMIIAIKQEATKNMNSNSIGVFMLLLIQKRIKRFNTRRKTKKIL